MCKFKAYMCLTRGQVWSQTGGVHWTMCKDVSLSCNWVQLHFSHPFSHSLPTGWTTPPVTQTLRHTIIKQDCLNSKKKKMYALKVASKNTLTLSGRQLVSVQPQSLVEIDAMNPAGQVLVKFWQLHTHSNTSQHFVFLTDSWRCAGQAGAAWRAHCSFLHTKTEKRWRETCERHVKGITYLCLCVLKQSRAQTSQKMSW